MLQVALTATKCSRRWSDSGSIFPSKTLRNSAYRRELIDIGGKAQVPCLIVDGRAIYESDAIIAWLRQNYGPKAFAEEAGIELFSDPSDLEDFPAVEETYVDE